jgi:hypothetical protein
MTSRDPEAGNFYEWWTLAAKPEASVLNRGVAPEPGIGALELSARAKSK